MGILIFVHVQTDVIVLSLCYGLLCHGKFRRMKQSHKEAEAKRVFYKYDCLALNLERHESFASETGPLRAVFDPPTLYALQYPKLKKQQKHYVLKKGTFSSIQLSKRRHNI